MHLDEGWRFLKSVKPFPNNPHTQQGCPGTFFFVCGKVAQNANDQLINSHFSLSNVLSRHLLKLMEHQRHESLQWDDAKVCEGLDLLTSRA